MYKAINIGKVHWPTREAVLLMSRLTGVVDLIRVVMTTFCSPPNKIPPERIFSVAETNKTLKRLVHELRRRSSGDCNTNRRWNTIPQTHKDHLLQIMASRNGGPRNRADLMRSSSMLDRSPVVWTHAPHHNPDERRTRSSMLIALLLFQRWPIAAGC